MIHKLTERQMARKTAGDRKAEIVAATLRLADELGPDRLTTQAIADAVGLTQPGIFRHFPTKQALWQAVAESVAGSMSEAWQRALANTDQPEHRLVSLIGVQLRHIAANPAIPAILHSRELQTENAELRNSFRTLMMRFQALLLRELTDGRDAAHFRADLDPKDCAVLLISLVQGLAIRWSLGNRAFALEAEGRRMIGLQLGLFRAAASQEGGA
jgi:AcrR family transcriptional regulator